LEKGNNLSTLAHICIKRQMLMHCREQKKNKNIFYLEDELKDSEIEGLHYMDLFGSSNNVEGEVLDNFEKQKEQLLVREALSALNEKEKILIGFWVGLDGQEKKTQREIAKIVGISQSHVNRKIKKALYKMSERLKYFPLDLEFLGYCAKTSSDSSDNQMVYTNNEK